MYSNNEKAKTSKMTIKNALKKTASLALAAVLLVTGVAASVMSVGAAKCDAASKLPAPKKVGIYHKGYLDWGVVSKIKGAEGYQWHIYSTAASGDGYESGYIKLSSKKNASDFVLPGGGITIHRVRVRAFKRTSSGRVYGNWSYWKSPLTVKVKEPAKPKKLKCAVKKRYKKDGKVYARRYKVKWSKVKGAKGYIVRVYGKAGKSGKRIIKVFKLKKNRKYFKTGSKVYKVRVRAYKREYAWTWKGDWKTLKK